MKKRINVLLLLLFFYCLYASAQKKPGSPDYSTLIEKYRSILQAEIQKNNIAGLSIALVDDDNVIWCEGFGFYDIQNKKQVTTHTPFNIGSICKTFTGLAIMQLQEDNKLNIDSAFKKYVPEFSMHSNYGTIDKIKIRDVLTHHAGIPDYIKDKFAIKPPYFTKVLDAVNNDYATFAPGTIFSYSNAGFSILGNLIENTSGQSYYDFVRQRILDPLDMSESGFVTDDRVPLSVHLGYNLKGEECTELAIFDAPAGCIYSSANDMSKYVQAYLNWGKFEGRQIFDSLTLVNMMQIQNQDVFLDFGNTYGLAWRTYYTDGGLSIQHDGGTLYHRAEVSISPNAGIGVVMLSNSSSGKPLLHVDYDIMNEAIQLKGYKKKPETESALKNAKHPEHNFRFISEKANNVVFTNMDGLKAKEICGWYGSFGVLCNVSRDTNALSINLNRNKFFLMPVESDLYVPAGENKTESLNSSERYYFENYQGKLFLVQIDKYGNHNIIGEKIDAKPLSNIWENRLGEYTDDGEEDFQMFSGFSLINVEGVLCLSTHFNMEMPGVSDNFVIAPLDIIEDHQAKISGFGRFSGQVLEFDENNEMRFMGFNLTKK